MKRFAIALAALSVLALTACSAGGEATARDACTNDAQAQIADATNWDFSDVETVDFSEALFELSDSASLDDDNRMWTSTGTVTYKLDNKTHKKKMLCIVTIENGKLTEPADAILT